MPLKIFIARSPEEIEELRGPWRRLFTSGSYTRFQSFEWNALAVKIFAERQSPVIVHARDDDGEAIIPAAIDGASGDLVLLGETLFDYRDILCSGNGAAVETAFEALGALGKELCVTAVREPLGAVWASALAVPFAKAPAALTQNSSRTVHARLGRCLRRILKQGCVLRQHSGSDTAIVRRIFELKAGQGDNLFRDPLRVVFLCQLAHLDAGAFDVFTLMHQDNIVSALITFRDANWRRFYTTYFDERWAALSPGSALLHEVMQQTLTAGMDCDFMTGEQPYKLRLATSSVPLYTLRFSSGQMLGHRASRLAIA